MSVLVLERPGRWRALAVACLLLLGALPVAALVPAALEGSATALGTAFWQSLGDTATVALGGAALGLLIGLPLGVGSSLTALRARRILLALIALPILVPSFLCAIGWSMLAAWVPSAAPVTRGLPGCVVIATTTTTALVLFAAYAATLELSRSQLEAAHLAGGEASVLRRAMRHALVPGLLAAALGAVLTLSDPGPGQILGAHTVAAEILTSFAARYDLALAAWQCMVLTLVVAALALPLAWAAGPRLAHAVQARQAASTRIPPQTGLAGAVALAMTAFVLFAVVPPLGALLLPIAAQVGDLPGSPNLLDDEWTRSHSELVLLAAVGVAAETAFNTVTYAGGAGLLATGLAMALALAVGRSTSLRAVALAGAVLLFSWPPAAAALGVAHAVTRAPPALDVLARSRFIVCLVLALHLMPVATVLVLRATGATTPSWFHAAAIHGVSLPRFLRRILWPALRPAAALSLVLVALLASADAGTVLLLHPPGERSLSLAIFTIMANAPEATVAALCLVYLLAALALLTLTLSLVRRGA